MQILTPLRDTPVALLWGGLSLSAIGDQLYIVSVIWIAVGLLGAWAGYLPALGAAVVLATALFGGSWADGREPRAAMIGADLIRALVLVLAVLEWTLRGHIAALTLLGLTVVLAIGQAVFRPALQGMLAPLVGERDRLPAANALLDTTDRIARLLGPGLVALLAAWLPPRHFLSLDAASFFASAVALTLIGRLRPLPSLRRSGPRENLIASARRGFRALSSHPVLWLEVRVNGILNGAWYAIIFLGVPLALAQEGPAHGGLSAFGAVISAYGSTNLLATLLIGGRTMPANPGRQVFAGNLVLGLGLLVIALSAAAASPLRLVGFIAGACIGAVGGPMHDIPVAVLRQTKLPHRDVPAAMRAALVANNTGVLIAMTLVPLIYAVAPVWMVMTGCAAIIILIGLIGLVRFGLGSEAPEAELSHGR